jgi:hypothetical protein
MKNVLLAAAIGLMVAAIAAVTAVSAVAGPSAVAGAARVAVIPLGSVASSLAPPRIVVDASGQGYTTWADGAPGAALDYCRLPWGTTSCASRQSFAYAGGVELGTDAGNAPVFTAGGALALLDSRCCLTSNQKFLRLSPDGGKTFGQPVGIVSDQATGISGNLLDLPAGALFSGSPEQLLTSSSGPVAGGGSIQATGLAAAPADPGWFTPQVASGSLSESVALQRSTLVAVFTQQSTPSYTVSWVHYLGGGDPNAASSWSAPQPISPAPSLDSNAQLAGGPSGIFVARSIATPGDNERLVVQKFTGSGWTSPVAISDTAAGERFAIDQTPAGIVYVIWKNTSGALQYKIAASTAATRFGATQTLRTSGDVEFPEIAVNATGAGWATWTDDASPAHAFALPIIPAVHLTTLRLSDAGTVVLGTPGGCVAAGSTFKVALGFAASKRKGALYTKVSRVAFSVSGARAETVSHAPYRASLTVATSAKPGSRVIIRARATIKAHHGPPPTKSISAGLAVCS